MASPRLREAQNATGQDSTPMHRPIVATSLEPERPKLFVRSGPLRGRIVSLGSSPVSIGRDLGSDLAVDLETVSGTHAFVIPRAGAFYLEDAGSKNGTFLRGARVERAPLRDGDVFRLGSSGPEVEFTFVSPVLTTAFESVRLVARPRLRLALAAGIIGGAGVLAAVAIAASRSETLRRAAPRADTPTSSPVAAAPGLSAQLGVELLPIYGALLLSYRDLPVGSVTVTNSGRTAVENARLSLDLSDGSACRFLVEPFSTGVPRLAPGETATVNLRPKLSADVLSTRTREVTATVVLEASGLALETWSGSLFLHDRNAFGWERPEAIAAFVDPLDGAARALVETAWPARPHVGAEEFPPSRIVEAMTLLEALAGLGMSYRQDSPSPTSQRADSHAVDRVSYPFETVLSRSGDCDDVSVLGCAVLEAAGLRTAFAVGAGHAFFLFDTGLSAESLASAPLEPETVVPWNGRIWMPIEATELLRPGSGFAGAWSAAWPYCMRIAAGEIRAVEIREAWRSFPPMEPPAGRASGEREAALAVEAVAGLSTRVSRAFEQVLGLVRNSLERRIEEATQGVASGPGRDRAAAVVYAGSGLFQDARRCLERALLGEDRKPGFADAEALRAAPPGEENGILLADLSYAVALGARTPAELDLAAISGEEAARRIPDASPVKPEVLLRQALVNYLRGELALARQWLEEAARLDPGAMEAYHRRTAPAPGVSGPPVEIAACLKSGFR